ncbi:hypothetical protein ACO0SA_001603 [Hanseniaspora valbyensis]
MDNYRSNISESSTKRFFNKIGQTFKKANIQKYDDFIEYYPSQGQQFIDPPYTNNNYNNQKLAQDYKNEINSKISILPLLQNAGLQINKLHDDVINALNQINIIDDITNQNYIQEEKIQKKKKMSYQSPELIPTNIDKTQMSKSRQLDVEEVILPYSNNYVVPKTSHNYSIDYKSPELSNKGSANFGSSVNAGKTLYSSSSEKPQGMILQSEIYGDFDKFQSEKTWKERKKQYNFKILSKNEIISEHILRSIDEVLRLKIKERELTNQLIKDFEKFLSQQHKLYLTEESETVIENFIKILEIENFTSQCNSQAIESLQNFVFGVYIREGTLKKCHSSLVTTSIKVDGNPVNINSNNIDLSFYYEELGKVKKNFQEDSKNYVDYVAQGGSIFLLNWFAHMQNNFMKADKLFNNLYLERFDFLYQLYPEEMINKLLKYEVKYKAPTWEVFNLYLNSNNKQQSSNQGKNSIDQTVIYEVPSSQLNIIEKDQPIKLISKPKKSKSHRTKLKAPNFDDYDDEEDSQTKLKDKESSLNIFTNLDLNRSIGNSSKLSKLPDIPNLNNNNNLESATAVENNNNKENESSPNLKEHKIKEDFNNTFHKDNQGFNETNNIASTPNRVTLAGSF